MPKNKKKKLMPEKKRKAIDPDTTECEDHVTIFKLVYKPETRAVYTGKTSNIHRRFKEHASRSSQCRLVRNAIRRHGIKQFAIEPIVMCHPADADANEAYYIMANNTMYPNGYNLRHGSGVGQDLQEETQLGSTFSNTVKCNNATDHFISQIDATADMMQICQNLEDCSSDEEECGELLDHVDWDRSTLR